MLSAIFVCVLQEANQRISFFHDDDKGKGMICIRELLPHIKQHFLHSTYKYTMNLRGKLWFCIYQIV